MMRGGQLRERHRQLGRVLVVLAGILAGQFVLYGPSLTGQKILLPLDILAMDQFYLPKSGSAADNRPHDWVLSDLVLATEPGRRYLGEELRAGRFPLWNPHQFAGVPNSLPKFSPFVMLGACFKSPRVLPWIEVLAACVGGLGMYAFCRRVLRVSFWPAAWVAWSYPLTAFFVFWLGYGVAYPVVWLPWMLLAVHQTVCARSHRAGAGLALITFLVLVSGRLDVAGQVMLVAGLFAVWCFLRTYHRRWFSRQAAAAGLVLGLGWGLGFMLAAPDYLPLLEYAQTGARMMRRSANQEERPPVGLAALPEVVLPHVYGSTQRGTVPDFPEGQGNLPESAAAGYAGLLAALFLAPLAWCSRGHHAVNAFWIFLALFALSWCLNLPLFVEFLRLPVLKMMSHNRLVFAAAFAVLALAAVGLEALRDGQAQWRWWFWAPAVLLAGIGLWSLDRALPGGEPVVQRVEQALSQGQAMGWIRTPDNVRDVRAWFARAHFSAALVCLAGVGGWLVLWWRRRRQPWLHHALGVVMLADLLHAAWGYNAQCDPALYYPRLPVLEGIRRSAPGRLIGYGCLPAALTEVHGLRDIRGYDAVDPARLMDLMAMAADDQTPDISYAQTQWFIPRVEMAPPDGIRLPPVLDMLGVRYVIFRGVPPAGVRPGMQGEDYWVMVNTQALPRVFVPQRVETRTNALERLALLKQARFDPREVACVESAVQLPERCQGTAAIVEETPEHVRVNAQMETAGLLVLADLWHPGWTAYADGQRLAVLRANHAVRGVVLPAGTIAVDFRYEPGSFRLGLLLSGVALLGLLGWLGLTLRTANGNARSRPAAGSSCSPRRA